MGKAFEKTANNFAENAGDDEKGKPIFKKNIKIIWSRSFIPFTLAL